MKDIYIGKAQTNGLLIGGRPIFSSQAQIFLECSNCEETIALLPIRQRKKSANEIIDSISDSQAADIFNKHGWTVHGYKNQKHTRCPKCRR